MEKESSTIIPRFTMQDVKRLALNNSWYLKDQIDTCLPGEIVILPTKLPSAAG